MAEEITWFASGARASATELQKAIIHVSENPVMDFALRSYQGVVAVLNEHRQVIAVNDVFLKALGIEHPDKALGLRPGEAANCVYEKVAPSGCGTGEACLSCGAAIAIVAALSDGEGDSRERECILSTQGKDGEITRSFLVKASQANINGIKLVFLSMRDTTQEKQRQVLGRAFFHDAMNMVAAVLFASEHLVRKGASGQPGLAHDIRTGARRLATEIEIHRALTNETARDGYRVRPSRIVCTELLAEVRELARNHPMSQGKDLVVGKPPRQTEITTSRSLLLRVLSNLVLNALEATELGGQVRIDIQESDSEVTFLVWSKEAIPAEIAARIFQPYFTTKKGTARGIGTYSVKLILESYLSGSVAFTSSEQEGTTFRVTVPRTLEQLTAP